MVPSIKLAVIYKTGKEASLIGKSTLYLSSLHSSRKQPYLISTSSYKLCEKHFIPHMHPILMMFTKIMWDKMVDNYEALHDCYIG